MIALSAIAGAVIYANVSVLLRSVAPWIPVNLPLPSEIANTFQLFGMFGTFSSTNYQFTLWGLPNGAAVNRTNWIPLPTDKLVPHHKGDQFMRLRANKHAASVDPKIYNDAMMNLGEKIWRYYNRHHPDQPISRVALQLDSWPTSPEGWDARRNNPGAVKNFQPIFWEDLLLTR
ncbi:MAG: hypothetical protein EXS36_15710 [Pedosphaera sp.]|nr:hypothetical protein [Pedosphaera sp.]